MNIQMLMQQAKKMQKDMAKKQKEFNDKEFSIENQGIALKMSGEKKILSINIDEILIDPTDIETLNDLLQITINQLMEKIDIELNSLMPKGSAGMPGLF